MGGCQNYGPFLGYPKYWVPYYTKEPKRDHNFDNNLDARRYVGAMKGETNHVKIPGKVFVLGCSLRILGKEG